MEKTKIDYCDSTWNPVPGHDGYFASADGQILSTKKRKPHIMKPISSKSVGIWMITPKTIMLKTWNGELDSKMLLTREETAEFQLESDQAHIN